MLVFKAAVVGAGVMGGEIAQVIVAAGVPILLKPEPGYEQAPVKLDLRGETAVDCLDNPPSDSLAPHVVEGLETAWTALLQDGAKAMVLASPNPALFSAGDHELFDAALRWGRRLARQAPLAIEQIKRVSHAGELDDGLAAERDAFLTAFTSEDAREGISAFLAKRAPRFTGK